MKVNVRVIYRYGGWNQLTFEKEFEMSYAPNKDISIYEIDKDYGENWIELREYNGNFHDERTNLMFQPNKEHEFYIEKETYWKTPVRGNVVDEILNRFSHFGWKRLDSTNIEVMKNLMSKEDIY